MLATISGPHLSEHRHDVVPETPVPADSPDDGTGTTEGALRKQGDRTQPARSRPPKKLAAEAVPHEPPSAARASDGLADDDAQDEVFYDAGEEPASCEREDGVNLVSDTVGAPALCLPQYKFRNAHLRARAQQSVFCRRAYAHAWCFRAA